MREGIYYKNISVKFGSLCFYVMCLDIFLCSVHCKIVNQITVKEQK